METFFWSLLLAILTGLTIVAYRHPGGFSRNVFPPLMILLIVFALGLISWYMGSMNELTGALLREVAERKDSANILPSVAESIAEKFAYLKYGLGVVVVMAAYFMALRLLPRILGEREAK